MVIILVVGIDIDDTLTKTTEKATELMHEQLGYSKLQDYHKLDRETFSKFVHENIFTMAANFQLFENGIEVIKYLKSKDIKVVFITARGYDEYEPLIALTNLYFLKYGIPYDEIIFAQESKVNAALVAKVDLFIDDKETVLDELANSDVKVLRIVHKDEESKHDSASNWLEVKEYVDKLLGVN